MNLNQITIPSSDLARSLVFYQHLGLELIVDSIPRYLRMLCPDGNTTFSVHHSGDLPTNGEGVWIYFECENLDEEVERLQEAGIVFEHGPKDQDWLWREARLRDPDGHRIILYYAGENRVNPPWRVKK